MAFVGCTSVGFFEESKPVMGLTIYPSGANDDGTLVSVELQRSSHVDRADHGDKPLPFTVQGVDANLAMELAVQQDVIDELARPYTAQQHIDRRSLVELPVCDVASTLSKGTRVLYGSPHVLAFWKPCKVGIVFPIVRLVQEVSKPSRTQGEKSCPGRWCMLTLPTAVQKNLCKSTTWGDTLCSIERHYRNK